MKIAVSGLNNTDNPAPGVPVIKSLKEHNTLVGLAYDPNEPGIYMDIVDNVYLMPYPSLGFEELKTRLEEIQKKEGLDAIIPNLDAELPLYIKYQQEIEAMGIKLCLPSAKNFELRNKNNLDVLSKELNIEYPKTYEISSIKELEDIVHTNKSQFPLMVKGNYYKAYMTHNLDSAIDSFYKISNEWGFPILIQEVVYGEELNLVGIADGKGELKGAVAIKKLTTTDIGKIWTGVTVQNEKLMKIAKDFVKKTLWKGPFELECIVNKDTIYMIEINPRFPAWVYFATQIGVNLPQMLVDILEEKDTPSQLEYPQNKMYVRYTGEFVTDFTDFMKLLSTKELSHE
ncbi:ATP-grasp domain-containing protein [Sulfurimonas sp. SAG-AH-194-I05]|nr:ATP-grasp domain-containing protein [Sulfurimonas sp. SAG-AH-194-I05]MDF1874498.1 ATP-grasp domain-containing protein [Sulfurimonas sp. SAG-AH-194-I05]